MKFHKKGWHNILKIIFYSTILTIASVTLIFSWGSTGHKLINLKAVMHLPESMASLKADSLFFRNHASDADGRKNKSDTAFFQEAFRHYIDIDIYPNYHSIPHSLDSMMTLYGRSNVRENGTLPWAIVLMMDSLTAQLARGDISKADSTMSDLGHYVGDGHQPLHCTKNYDGEETGNDGIHSRYESSMINTYQSSIVINWDSVRYISSPLDFAFDFIYHTNSLVDSVLLADDYAKSISGGSINSTYYTALWDRTNRFTKEQFQHATIALASLWYTAWVNSQTASYDTISSYTVLNNVTTPLAVSVVQSGTNNTVTFNPPTGYHVDSIYVDGVKIDSLTGYTFHSLSSNHEIIAWYSINLYTITSSAGLHGTINPLGSIILPYDSSQYFSVMPDSGFMLDEILIDGSPVDSTSGYSFINVESNHSITVTFKPIPFTIECTVTDKWNMVSLPLQVSDRRVSSNFPSSASQAFAFYGNYVTRDTLAHGTGYWLKFNEGATISFQGTRIENDTVNVVGGWNMLGSISHPLSTSCIQAINTTLQSPFFGYENGYYQADVIIPGKAYWVKVSTEGKLIFQSCEE